MGKYINIHELWTMIKAHLTTSLIFTFFGTILVSFSNGTTSKYLFSLICIAIYMLTLYTRAEEIARYDKKSYTEKFSYPLKGVVLPIGILGVWVLLFILYSVSWKYDIISYNSGFINNLLFVIWNYMYKGFLNFTNGSFNYYYIILIVLVPITASGLGYLAGLKNFDLSKKVVKMVYEEKKEDINENEEE